MPVPMNIQDLSRSNQLLRMATYLLGTSSAKLSLCVGIVHIIASEHLGWLSIALVRVLLPITSHMSRVHLRSSVLGVWRSHRTMLHAVVWRRHLLLSLLLGNLSGRGLAAGVGTFRGTAMASAVFSRNNVDEKVEHIAFRQRRRNITPLQRSPLVVFCVDPCAHG